MKKILISFIFLAMAIYAPAQTAVNTRQTTLVIDAPLGGVCRILYYGARLDASDVASVKAAGLVGGPAYPAYGLEGEQEAAIAVVQPDGDMTLDLRVCSVETSSWDGGSIVTVTSADPVYPITVRNVFRSFDVQDVIETWAEIVNNGKKPVTMTRYFSGMLPVRSGDVYLSTLYGSWGNESRVCTEPVGRGYRVIKSTGGVATTHIARSEVMLSLDGHPRENEGRVIGATLEWGGNYELSIRSENSDYYRLLAGICPDNAAYSLGRGETFTTPALAYSFSGEGLSGVSRNFHRWGRKYRLAHGDRERKILLNSWEGVYMDVNEPVMEQMMGDIASMGGELFVMDDGWFGGKYARTVDDRGLGDWMVDRRKLPHGIGWLVKTAEDKGIKFGIWIEPEMTNSASELYEKHPDWVVGSVNRDLVGGRGGTQLVLDLSNPAVQDFVFGVVDGIMKDNPGVDYIKWDANMNIASHGSQYLKNQSHLHVAYWHGLYKVLDRVRAAYPDLTIQTCASGGGRVNWGVLPWFDEFWTSDNTDALQRIYMQWGTSYFYPSIAMASHISASPNHQLHRMTSLKYRIDVAMTGRLGMEIQPKDMTEAEKAQCRKAIAEYRQVRPVIQFGDLYRLISPYDNQKVASLMYVSEAKDEAVFFWWKTEAMMGTRFPRVRMHGLDPDRMYKVTELDRIDLEPLAYEGMAFSGRFLMESGLEIPAENKPAHNERTEWSSRVLRLQAQPIL